MGKYVSITGSLLCSNDQVRIGKDYIEGLTSQDIGIEISQEQFELYMTGWFFPINRMNWMNYIFYGGSVRESSTELIKIVLQKLIRRIQEECTNDDHNVEGYFWLISEEGNQVFWKIDSEVIEIKPC